MARRLRILALVLLGLVSCAHAPASGPPRAVAVVPVDTLAVPASDGDALRTAVEKELSAATAHRAVPRAELGPLDPGDARCRESDACLAETGRLIPSDLVLTMTIAGLGSTRLVRSRLVGTQEGLVLQDLQDTFTGGPQALDSFAHSLVRRLLPEPEVATPWHRRWWIWLIGGGLVAGAATTTAVLVTRASGSPGVLHLGNL